MSSAAPLIKERDGFADAFGTAIGGAFVARKDHVGELTITVTRDGLVEAARTLRDRFGYQQLMEIAGVDYPERPERFEVVYHFLSVTENHRVRLKVSTDEETPVPSLTGLWPVAGWLEREVFDMYGVIFSGNPDLRRILTDYGFEGHPQRKDFPLTGHVELRYSEAEKRVVYEPVQLPQDFRTFDFLMPWEGPEYVLPGDEKAAQAPGAPSPAPAPASPPPAAKAPPPTPKTTDTPAKTGAGEPANTEAKKKSPAAPKPPKADKAPKAAAKPRAPKKPAAPKKGQE
ncbi:NADH-quinone oxidoreductase subunit C [Sphingomonas rhizophila]|uniref:NADH-quinone oxidoreductase subunit C n=1 Tax=Sphingomonas rhizophila TaxID=2071607 RepID=A0A7G9SDV2_9SPHN|nr:NADH-quinone oxidoreductase subunit C [Sphingomonas rhizophila]QNN66027.1 NADH-quinone oxidoreductase subunit C [Sphingomonas rhizophila]